MSFRSWPVIQGNRTASGGLDVDPDRFGAWLRLDCRFVYAFRTETACGPQAYIRGRGGR
jgi:hypothetical protein